MSMERIAIEKVRDHYMDRMRKALSEAVIGSVSGGTFNADSAMDTVKVLQGRLEVLQDVEADGELLMIEVPNGKV